MVKKDLTNQKYMDLRAAHDRLLSTKGVNLRYVSRDVVSELLTREPAPCFYLSPRTIEHIVMRYFKGKKTTNPERTKDLVEAFYRVRDKKPTAPMEEIWYEVSIQPAKSFYLSARNIRDIIYHYR